MRVILKPGGLVVVLAVFSGLMFSVYSLMGAKKSSDSVKSSVGIQNSGFESDFMDVVPYDNKATLSGRVAAPWQDDSSWARVNVAYSEESTSPHGGKTCQRMEIRSVTRGQTDNERDVVQLNQAVTLIKGKTYRASLWVRASEETEVEISLRQKDWPYKYDAAKVERVGKEWKEIAVSGTSTVAGSTYIMLKAWRPTTLWVDDASLTPI